MDNEFLPINEEYNEVPSVTQEVVEEEPKRFIIEECLPACFELWRKNIYTFMVSDHLNPGECWIEVIKDALSEENQEVYMTLGDDVEKFSYHRGSLNFGVNCVGLEAQERLLEIAKKFKMQDVPKDQAYITIEKFLMDYCGCYDQVENPNYRFMEEPWDVVLESDKLIEYMHEYDKWQASDESKKTIRKYNPDKARKPLDVLLKDNNMILDGDRVYISPFHYQKHMNYVEYKQKELSGLIQSEQDSTGTQK